MSLCRAHRARQLDETANPSPPLPRRATIVVVDDHPIMRRGLTALLNCEPDLEVRGEAASAQSALQVIAQQAPDLVIVDLGLDGSDGLDLVKALRARHPGTRLVVLSMHDESVYAERVLRAGAHGYVSKQQLEDSLLTAVRRALAGEIYMSPALGARLAQRYIGVAAAHADSPVATLTDRQLTVFRLIGQGQTTRQIALALHLSIKTIEAHREHIKHKLGLESGAALARCAALWTGSGRSA